MSPEKEFGAAEYLCYEVIHQMEDQGRDVPETDFNKFCSLVYEEVADEDVDVPLPIYWYEYGNVVDTNHINDSLLKYERTRWGSNWGRKVTIRDVSDDAFDVADSVLGSIKTAASSVAKRFGDVYGTSYARYQSYDRQAPNEFIKVMNEFRDVLDDYEGEDAANREEYVHGVDATFSDLTGIGANDTRMDDDFDDGELREFLRKLVQTFPDDTYTVMDGEFYEWQSTCRDLIRHNLYGDLRRFQSEFWNSFSKVELRVKHNENLPPGKIMRWQEERQEHIEAFQQQLEGKRKVVDSHREDTNKINAFAASYDAAVQSIYDRFSQNNS